MKQRRTIATFLFKELPSLMQILTLPVLLSVFSFQKTLIGPILTGIFGGLAIVYLEVQWKEYCPSKRITKKQQAIIIISCVVLFGLMIIAQIVSK